jgi:hypothetical protein
MHRMTRAQVEALRQEAGAAGDAETVQVCDRALAGSARAMRACERIIRAEKARQGLDDHPCARYSIENIAGGGRRWFRMVAGSLSDQSIRYADSVLYGGPVFGGPAGEIAHAQYECMLWDRAR